MLCRALRLGLLPGIAYLALATAPSIASATSSTQSARAMLPAGIEQLGTHGKSPMSLSP